MFRKVTEIILTAALLMGLCAFSVSAEDGKYSGVSVVYQVIGVFTNRREAKTIGYGDTNGFWRYDSEGGNYTPFVNNDYGFYAYNWIAIRSII